MKKHLLLYKLVLIGLLLSFAIGQSADHLLISEFVLAPSDAEFIELYNPTSSVIDLSDYYITDGTDSSASEYYYRLVEDSSFYSGTSSDFIARFPEGSTIGAEQYVILAKLTSEFHENYGFNPDFELQSESSTVPDMRDAVDSESTIGTTSGGYLSNSSEVLILFKWDGESDLVEDVDYTTWGNQSKGVDKSGIAIDGPDGDNDLSQYLDDTPLTLQSFTATTSTTGKSIQRQFPYEIEEDSTGGNGITNHNESSENLDSSFVIQSTTPGFGLWETLPQITDVVYFPSEPIVGDTLTVEATITDIDGNIVTARLIYTSAVTDSVEMTTMDNETYSGSVELLSADLFMFNVKAVDDSGNVSVSPEYTIAIQQSYPPEIVSVNHNPSSPISSDYVTVTLVGMDDDSISSAILKYTTSEDLTDPSLFVELNMNLITVENTSFTFQGTIHPFGEDTTVTYYSIITDNHGLTDSLTQWNQYTISGEAQDTTIAFIIENLSELDGQIVTVDGVITIPPGILRTNVSEAFLQDESGKGIVLFAFDIDESLSRGDSVLVTATVDEYDGKPELIDYEITLLESNVTVPVVELDIEEFNTLNYSYTFVKLWGRIIARSNPSGSNEGANIDIQDETGEVTTVRIWNSTNILYDSNFVLINEGLDSLLQVGTDIEVYGIGDSYLSSSQILPAFVGDIKFIGDLAGFSFELLAQGLNGEETVMTFGMAAEATDDYDEDYDVYAPPPPPSGFDAALVWENERYYTQIIAHSYGSRTMGLRFNELSSLKWNSAVFDSVGSFTLLDGYGGTDINVDMTKTDSIDTVMYPDLQNLNTMVINFELDKPDSTSKLQIAPYPFVPQWGEVIQFKYSYPDNSRIKLRVFDLSGRHITTLFDEFRSIHHETTETWNGRNDLNEVVPPGVYLMHLEVTDKLNGKTTTDVAPVVIGVRMQ